MPRSGSVSVAVSDWPTWGNSEENITVPVSSTLVTLMVIPIESLSFDGSRAVTVTE